MLFQTGSCAAFSAADMVCAISAAGDVNQTAPLKKGYAASDGKVSPGSPVFSVNSCVLQIHD